MQSPTPQNPIQFGDITEDQVLAEGMQTFHKAAVRPHAALVVLTLV